MRRNLMSSLQHRHADKWIFINTIYETEDEKSSNCNRIIKTIGYINVDEDIELHNQIGFFEDMEFTNAYEKFIDLYFVSSETKYSLSDVIKFISLYDYLKNRE